jgi:hypothetical protein
MRVDLHIGIEKTGSTSIQAFLRANREALLRQGVLYPHATGEMNQVRLAAYAADAAAEDRVLRRHGAAEGAEQEAFRRRLEQELETEAAESSATRMILSSEHCSSRLCSDAEVGRLRGLLERAGREFRIIVYLRRQDDLLLSKYSTSLKSGGVARFAVPSDPEPRFAFAPMLERWARVFGEGALKVRVFDKTALAGSGLLRDFCAAADLDVSGLELREEPRNASLSVDALEVLRLLNENRLLDRDLSLHRRVVQALGRIEGPKLSLGSATRRRLLADYAAGNAEIARRWLGRADGRLFADVEEGLPEVLPSEPTPERIAAVAAEVLMALGEKLQEKQARRGEKLKRRDDKVARRARRAARA